MEALKLPIDVVPGSAPPKFRWRQTVDTLAGRQVIDHEATLPPTVEVAVVRLIGIAKQLMMENAALQGQVQGHCDRIAAQSEVIVKQAEKAAFTTVTNAPPIRKGK